MDIQQEFEKLIDDTLASVGGKLKTSKRELAVYAAERSIALATMIENDEPGFDQGVNAAKNNLAMMAGIKAGAAARHVDDIWAGIFAGALRFAAIALAGSPAVAAAAATAAELVAETIDPPGTGGPVEETPPVETPPNS